MTFNLTNCKGVNLVDLKTFNNTTPINTIQEIKIKYHDNEIDKIKK